jgi:hypothetical protein
MSEQQVMCECCGNIYARVDKTLCYLCENALNSMRWDIEHKLEHLSE